MVHVTETKPASGRPPRGRRRSQSERREETSERILDAAESLFAEHGVEPVTIRQIAKKSGVDTALVHYYFNTKPGVFAAVLERRADFVNSRRTAALDLYEVETAGQMTAAGLVRAYLTPTFSFMLEDNPGHRDYGAVIGRLNSAAAPPEMRASGTVFDPVVHRLVRLLGKVRPECAEADIYWFYHLMSGAISLSLSQTGRIDLLSDGACRSDDFAVILERMVAVFGRGFSALPPSAGEPG